MNNYIKCYSILAFSFIVSSCKKDFLDVPDSNTALRQTYVVDLKTTGDFLNGIYIVLGKDFYNANYQIYPDLIADNIKLATASSTGLGLHYNWSQISDNLTSTANNMNGAWMYGYQVIRSCSFVLEKAEEFKDQNPNKANDLKAQAYGLRALVHFVLVNLFAQPYGFTADGSHPGIPYIISYDWTQPVSKRNTVAEVYTNIINDLTASLSFFSSQDINPLLLNKSAAKALLARTYLFKGDYQAAKSQAKAVCTTLPIMAAGANGYPSKLFTDKETEALFQLMPSRSGVSLPSTAGSYTGTYSTDFQGRYFATPKNFVATADIAMLLTQNSSDLRKNWVTSSSGSWTITKYPANVVAGFSSSTQAGAYYPTLLRSSEMYLTTAESYARLNNEDSARYFLNEIRTRANIPIVTSSVTGTTLMDTIYQERRREFAFEGLRMFDLLRLKKGVNRSDAWGSSVQTLPYPSDKAIAPLPQNDVKVAGLSQNIGYY